MAKAAAMAHQENVRMLARKKQHEDAEAEARRRAQMEADVAAEVAAMAAVGGRSPLDAPPSPQAAAFLAGDVAAFVQSNARLVELERAAAAAKAMAERAEARAAAEAKARAELEERARAAEERAAIEGRRAENAQRTCVKATVASRGGSAAPSPSYAAAAGMHGAFPMAETSPQPQDSPRAQDSPRVQDSPRAQDPPQAQDSPRGVDEMMAPPPIESLASAESWYCVDHEGVAQGPFEAARVLEWFEAGYLPPESYGAPSFDGRVPPDFWPLGVLLTPLLVGNAHESGIVSGSTEAAAQHAGGYTAAAAPAAALQPPAASVLAATQMWSYLDKSGAIQGPFETLSLIHI